MIMKFRVSGRLAYQGLLLVLLASTLLLQGCMNRADGSEDKSEAGEKLSVPVEAATVSSGDMAAFYSGTASLEADEQAIVVSQITGVVLQIHAEEGDFVEAGQVLVKVETDRYALEVEKANAGLKRLQTDLQRKKELFEKKLVSAEDFERVSAEYDAQKAAHDLARLDLEYTNIRAPISGYISERLVRAGNLVKLHQPVLV
jgi:membrane fusion protein (multidrug efflux system)